MQEIPHPWGEYARLQAISAKTSKIDSISWGIEAEMDALLADSSRHTSRDARRLERLRKTVARRERSRAHLRKAHSAELATEPPNATSQLEAREALQRIEAKVTSTQWAVITALGQGYSFADIGLEQGISAGAARAQIFRLRQHLSELRPAA